jgi:hypothetical protein
MDTTTSRITHAKNLEALNSLLSDFETYPCKNSDKTCSFRSNNEKMRKYTRIVFDWPYQLGLLEPNTSRAMNGEYN